MNTNMAGFRWFALEGLNKKVGTAEVVKAARPVLNTVLFSLTASLRVPITSPHMSHKHRHIYRVGNTFSLEHIARKQ